MTSPTTTRRTLSSSTARTNASAAPLTILIVDDDFLLARLLKGNLDQPGYVTSEAVGSAEDALARLAKGGVHAVVTDVSMPGLSGIELVQRIRETDRNIPIILMTAFATVELAVQGIRAGAVDFLHKPVNVDALLALIERAVAERPVREEIAERSERRAAATVAQFIVGEHPALDEVRRFATRVAATPAARVLITGESGTGKSMLARAIHELSLATGRFVEVNCAALPAPLLETELFGHERGAFTDARTLKRGLIETAEHGTLFLDEIGALPLDLQSKLLVFLETREIRRVGGLQTIPVRTRVIAATNDDLRERVRQREFRQDLLFRLDVAAIRMPPLREMPEVLAPLAERFLRDLSGDLGRPMPAITPHTFSRLEGYAWPGNARELRNVLERALIFHEGGALQLSPPLPVGDESVATTGVLLERGLTLGEVERRYIEAMLALDSSEYGRLADRLGISRKTLWEKRRRYGL
jgi:DNA-binding NtrC family response regulator